MPTWKSKVFRTLEVFSFFLTFFHANARIKKEFSGFCCSHGVLALAQRNYISVIERRFMGGRNGPGVICERFLGNDTSARGRKQKQVVWMLKGRRAQLAQNDTDGVWHQSQTRFHTRLF